MKRLLILLFPLIISSQNSENYTLSGFISDSSNGETLIGVNITVDSLNIGTSTNNYGFYSLTLPKAQYNINFSYIGYKTKQLKLKLDSNITYNTELSLIKSELDEIVVSDKKNIVQQTQTSQVTVPIKQIFKIPALLGEVDVLKAIQLLPGVQSSEGTSGFYVRGGGPDQNLILLDGVPVYNASHLGGLFSVFNPDAIKNVNLIKGGFPARYGGRLSSVLEISMKEGNMKKFKADMTLGLISSKLTLEGPIIKNKTSFIVSARRTYADLLVRPFIPDNTSLGMYFYDLNMKINHRMSNNDRVFISSYIGRDKFSVDYEEGDINYSDRLDFGLGYGNITSTIRWNHLFSEKLFSNTTITYSRYSFNTDFGLSSNYSSDDGNEIYNIGFAYLSGIEDYAARIDFDFSPNPNHNLKFGYSFTNHNFFPGETSLSSNFESSNNIENFSIDTILNFSQDVDANEIFLYVEDNIKLSDKLKTNIGIHAGYYSSDKLSIQPRISSRYLLNENWSLKISYAQMRQNIHLLSNSSVGFPSDLWLPAIDSVPPQTSRQFVASVNTTLKDGKYDLSLEIYHKKMTNLITYKAGYSNLQSTENWENAIETGGVGESYGLEFFLQRKTGKTTGWLGYTLSWTNRQFENVNFGQRYPYKYDRRHDISVVLTHKINSNWDFSFTWSYGTGNAITFPQQLYLSNPQTSFNYYQDSYVELIESYGERNSTRMQAYHRLDIGFTHTKKKNKFDRIISFGAYNAYNRKNPFFAYLSYDLNGNRVARQVSLFPVIPSVSYRIKF